MKNLENYGVKEMSNRSSKLTIGGSWLGKAFGKGLGILFRYGGPNGGVQLSIDYATHVALNS